MHEVKLENLINWIQHRSHTYVRYLEWQNNLSSQIISSGDHNHNHTLLTYKYYVYIDGSFISSHVNAGWGYVTYDACRCIYLTNCGSIPGCNDAEEAELRTLLNALLYVK